ncbi:MAG: hypothetical protein LUC30_02570 [Clostridiales bacterium]|nr:hypothetical protein [Clostridiales bacterium]
MSRRKSDFWDGEDDGRTIADMSGVTRPSMFGHMPAAMQHEDRTRQSEAPGKEQPPWEEQPATLREQLACALGAMGAALCIGLIYVAVLGLIILLMVICWT